MTTEIKDWFQMAAWGVAVIGGLIAAFKGIAESRRANENRRLDLRWKQAEMAKKCIDEINANSLSRAAMKMLDWSGVCFDTPDGEKTKPITYDVRRSSLRTTNTSFPDGDDGPFIRDAFDSLFDGFERLEHFVQINLITFEDVEQAFRYYVAKLTDPTDAAITKAFLEMYGFKLAQRFLMRFSHEKGEETH